MIDVNSKLLLILKEKNKSTLVSRGKYDAAKIKVQNGHTDNEKYLLLEKSKTIVPAKFNTATKTVKLGYAFIQGELNIDKNGKSHRPDKPKGKHSFFRFRLWEHWNTMSQDSRLRAVCEIYANDESCELVNFEIL